MNSYFSSSALEKIFSFWNLKCSSSIWNPKISFIWSFTLTYNFNCVSNNKWWIKSNSKLTNNLIIHLCSNLFQKLFWSTSCYCSKIINHFLFCHTYSWILFNRIYLFTSIVIVLFYSSNSIFISRSDGTCSPFCVAKNLCFSNASEALDNNSLKNTSLSV